MVLRDNYLGSFTHFSTLYEYLEKRSNGHTLGDPVVQKYREGHVGQISSRGPIFRLNASLGEFTPS